MAVIIASPQERRKDTVASSPEVGIAVRANGEEKTQIIDRLGNVFEAGIPAPTAAVTTSLVAGGTLPLTTYYAYRYCYVAKTAYPLVDQIFAINGSLGPRGNPSPSSATVDIRTAAGANKTIRVNVTQSAARADLTNIWVFRTTGHATQAEALNASEAGLMYFIKELTNVTQAWDDDNSIALGADQIELDNFPAPTAAYVIYRDPYWWMIGNPPLIVLATWVTTTAVITLDPTAGKWFTGRNGQAITLTGVTTGGFDGHGGYYLKVLTDTTGELYLNPELTSLGSAIATNAVAALVTVQGPPTTLYRSKKRNPLSWGHEIIIGTSKSAELFAHKVAGGRATAIATIPAEPILKIDCKFPVKVITYNLQAASNLNDFKGTERTINELFSVSVHHSQFVATLQNGACVLWGYDAENYSILQSDGISQRPISASIPKILRQVSPDAAKVALIHGIYDPFTETNCMWIPIDGGGAIVNYMVFQHVPSGSWGFVRDHDVLCSAAIPNATTNRMEILVGTEAGLMGQAFAPGVYSNWNPAVGRYMGTVDVATDTTISISAADELANPFNNTLGMVGNWVLITDANGENETWARISATTTGQLTFNAMWSRDFPSVQGVTFSGISTGIPQAGYKFYVGLIECSFMKYFDGGTPFVDKSLLELWVHQTNLDQSDDTYTKVRHFYELEPLATLQFDLNQIQYEGGRLSDVWFTKRELPSELLRVFGLEFINRGYTAWTFTEAEIIMRPAP